VGGSDATRVQSALPRRLLVFRRPCDLCLLWLNSPFPFCDLCDLSWELGVPTLRFPLVPHRKVRFPLYPIEIVSAFDLKSSEDDCWSEIDHTDYLIRRSCIITLPPFLQSSFCPLHSPCDHRPLTTALRHGGGSISFFEQPSARRGVAGGVCARTAAPRRSFLPAVSPGPLFPLFPLPSPALSCIV
jgi:hypothetical protein